MKFVIAIFNAERETRTQLSSALEKAFGLHSVSTHDFEQPAKDAARTMFGIDSRLLAHEPEKWSETRYYGRTVNQILASVYKFGTSLNPGVWIDRILDEIKFTSPTCPYAIIRDGRSKEEWDLLTDRRTNDFVLVGVLIKKGRTSVYDEDKFDFVIQLSSNVRETTDLDQKASEIKAWIEDVHRTVKVPAIP